MRRWIGAIAVSCEELAIGVAQEVLEGFGKLGVVHREIETAEDCADVRVGCPTAEVEGLQGIVCRILCALT